MTYKVREIMTPRERLVTVPEGTTPEQAKALFNKHKLERLLVINDRVRTQRADHRQGHYQANQFSQCCA
jgi:CBS domain-containing protein